jgi:hypothetical protein
VHEPGKDALEPDIDQQNIRKNCFGHSGPEQDDIYDRTEQGDNEKNTAK